MQKGVSVLFAVGLLAAGIFWHTGQTAASTSEQPDSEPPVQGRIFLISNESGKGIKAIKAVWGPRIRGSRERGSWIRREEITSGRSAILVLPERLCVHRFEVVFEDDTARRLPDIDTCRTATYTVEPAVEPQPTRVTALA